MISDKIFRFEDSLMCDKGEKELMKFNNLKTTMIAAP